MSGSVDDHGQSAETATQLRHLGAFDRLSWDHKSAVQANKAILLVAIDLMYNEACVRFFTCFWQKTPKKTFSLVLVCHCYKNKAQAMF